MAYKPTREEKARVHNLFDPGMIWTQRDIMELAEVPQAGASMILQGLVEKGFIYFQRCEGIRQIKFYTRMNQ